MNRIGGSSASSRAPLSIVAAYLAVTAPAALLGARGGAVAVAVAAAHVAALAGVFAIVRRLRAADEERGVRRTRAFDVIVDWLPLAAVPLLYAELPFLIAGAGSGFHDALVQSWETSLFGGSPAHLLAGSLPYEWLSELLHAGYLSYYALIYGPPLALYVRGRRPEFSATVAAVMTTFAVCFAVFVVFPVAGPRYLWPAPFGVPTGPIRSLVLRLLDAGSSRGAAFPSSHVAVAVTQVVFALRFQRRIGIISAVLTVFLAAGAVYGGFHYGVDVLAGACVGVLVAAVALAREPRPQSEALAPQVVSAGLSE